MALSNDLLSQFVKASKPEANKKTETTVYGTIVNYNDNTCVKLDGSDIPTPIISTVETVPGDRVTVMIKNHSAVVTGNLTSKAVRTETIRVINEDVLDVRTLLADTVKTDQLNAEKARIDNLEANQADITTLTADYAAFKTTTSETLTAASGDIEKLKVDKLDVNTATATYATIINLNATNAEITDLKAKKLDAETANLTYANIEFTNVGEATMASFYANSGLIQNAVINNGTLTGELIGVTISGNLIKAGTLVADKLVIKGDGGLYYKLNTDGVKTEAEQTDYNSLNGDIITAKSITASKVNVSDLVAFGATVGGFTITENSLYSGVKSAANNTTRGIYLDNDGQSVFGDGTYFVKYYKDTDNAYKLNISAKSIVLDSTDLTVRLTNAGKTATDYMNLSSSGLVVGQNPSSPTAGNTLISADGVSIRKGTTILAAFKAASRTASGISSATLTSNDSADSESDGITSVSGTITSGGTRANVYITTNGNPAYFPNGLETDKVLINNNSGIISNANILLNGSLVDKSGEGILTPLNSYGNMVIGYGRFQDGGGTYVYGTRVKAKTKDGFFASVDGSAAIETNNDNGNATFGWHLYDAGSGDTTVYGYNTGLTSKNDIRLNADGNYIRFDGGLVPYTGNKYNIGTSSLSIHDIYISNNDDNTIHGLKFSNTSGSYNAVGVNADGYQIFGNTDFCTNIITKSTSTSSTGYSFKITCGNNPSLTLDDNDARLLLFGGTDSTSRYLGSMAVYKRTYSSAANVLVTENGIIGRSTSSSKRYKRDISTAGIDELKGLYSLPIKKFKYNNDYISNEDELYEKYLYGFIVEDLEDILPCAVQHKDGLPEMWNSNIIVPSLLKLIQDLNSRLSILEGEK